MERIRDGDKIVPTPATKWETVELASVVSSKPKVNGTLLAAWCPCPPLPTNHVLVVRFTVLFLTVQVSDSLIITNFFKSALYQKYVFQSM